MRLNTNINSLNVFRNAQKNELKGVKALDKLTSGKKLLKAKDAPNKIGQVGEMRIKLKSLQMAERNLQDTSSMLQATDGALNEISNLLTRMKELTIKGVNDTNNDGDKKILQDEIDSIKEGISEIVEGSQFNGKSLISNKEVSDNKYPDIIKSVSGNEIGEVIEIPTFNFDISLIRDKEGNSLKDVNIKDKENGAKYISTVDEAISFVSGVRGRYGAIQNRVESGSQYLSSVGLTNERAISSLEDSDMALEILEYTKIGILNNVSMSLMKQSNNLPKEILGILERIK